MENRSLIELYELVLVHFDGNFTGGLCGLYASLNYIEEILDSELVRLKVDLKDNTKGLSDYWPYVWPKGEAVPRLEFINRRIAELKALQDAK